MTEREALPYEDLGAWFTDDLRPGWARYWSQAPAAPPKPPWYRNPRVLLAVITVAAAALVVAAALLESGQYTPESTVPNLDRLTLPGTNSEVRNSNGKTCGPGDQVTLATTVSLSCNIPLAEFGMALGYKPIVEMAKKFYMAEDYH